MQYPVEFYSLPAARICKSFKHDCVIRAVSTAMSKPYTEVFEDLMRLGTSMGAYPNHKKVWQSYLENNGWTKNKCPRDASGKLIKLGNWVDRPQTAVIINSGHLTALSGGIVTDEWDCRYRPVNTYWNPHS